MRFIPEFIVALLIFGWSLLIAGERFRPNLVVAGALLAAVGGTILIVECGTVE